MDSHSIPNHEHNPVHLSLEILFVLQDLQSQTKTIENSTTL